MRTPRIFSLTTRSTTDSYTYYHYSPSLPLAATFTALFTLLTFTHLFRLQRSKTYFMIPLAIGAVFEATGYATRIPSAFEAPGPYSLAPYLVSAVLILIAPTLMAASIYMELGRIVRMVRAEDLIVIRRGWLTKTFVLGDCFAFGIQSAGASLLSSDTPSTVKIGNYIVIAGLITQIISFALFLVVAGIFHVRMAKIPPSPQLARDRPWSKHMISLYVVSALIFVRSVVRVVEYIQGTEGYIFSHEVFVYVFDGGLMGVAVAVMGLVHPGEVAVYLREMRKEEGEVRGVSSESTMGMMEMA